MASNRNIAVLLAGIGLAAVVFTLAPGLDLAASAAFYRTGAGFPLQDSVAFDLLRRAIWGASIALFVVALVAGGVALFGPRLAAIPARLWGFVLLLYTLGPGVLVEWGLKGHWGRARPADVTQFGGPAQFTPFWDATDQCVSNCSFVGGESAGATVLAICLLLILEHLRPRLSILSVRVWQAIALAMPLIAGFHRLATGRHFLSDVVFSVLFVALLAAVMYRVWSPLPHTGRAVDIPPDSP